MAYFDFHKHARLAIIASGALSSSVWVTGCSPDRFESSTAVCGADDPTCAATDVDATDVTAGTDEGSPSASGMTDSSETTDTEPSPTGTGAPAATDTASTDVANTDPAGTDTTPAATDASETDTPAPPEPANDCDEPTTGQVRAYFEVPGTDADLGDYFRLPFPNDFYLEQGQPQLGDFPAKTALVGGFIDAVEQHADGFSASPTIIFRFSGRVEFSTLVERFHVVDLTDLSSPPLKLLYSPSSGKYVCHNALAARPSPGHAFNPGHTYAAYIDVGVLDREALAVETSPQLQALLADEAPTEPVLAELHTKYGQLRDYLADLELAPSDILNATVFSVGDVRAPMTRLSADVADLDVPTASAWTLCDGATASPCPDASAERACGEPSEVFDEYHALVELPIFQQGEAPYFDSGGEISYAGPVRTEAVCMALTVPKGTPPDGGFPLVLTSHGAGGSFRSHLSPSVAGSLSEGETVDGTHMSFAVLGYDGVQHGPRRGDGPSSGLDPDILLFNILNPGGTLGTSLQGGLDVLSMSRFAKDLPDQVPAEFGIQLDTERVMFWGHSQGAMQGAIALPYTDDVHAAVFSGLGAGFLQTMLTRTDPEFIPTTVSQAINDPGPNGELVFGEQFHPALALVQQLIDPVDTLHHAELLVAAPVTDPLHVFQVYGARDAYSPAVAQQSFAIAAELTLAATDPDATDPEDFLELSPSDALPLSGNLSSDGALWTAGVRQYTPADGNNGHFVAFQVATAMRDVRHFLATAVAHDEPSIGQ